MNETMLRGNQKVSIGSYKCWGKNRTEQGGGGIATAIVNEYKDSVINAGEGSGEDEYLVTRIGAFNPALCIVNCYGEQRKMNIEDIEAKWMRLKRELDEIVSRNEFCLLIGDLNKLVGCDEYGVPGNHPEVSPGGKLLRELLMTGKWFLVNGMGWRW